jgi:uncharacterized membrane protein
MANSPDPMNATQFFLILKSLHVFGAILFLGNILLSGWWKIWADRDGDPKIVAFAQKLVARNDFVFTSAGVVLILGSGIAMTALFRPEYLHAGWFAWGFWLFVASGAIWFGVLIPVQRRQSSLARRFAREGAIPSLYWRLERVWMAAGVVAACLPLANLYWMIFKPY